MKNTLNLTAENLTTATIANPARFDEVIMTFAKLNRYGLIDKTEWDKYTSIIADWHEDGKGNIIRYDIETRTVTEIIAANPYAAYID